MSATTQTTPISKFRKSMSIFLGKLRSWADRDQLKELEKFELKYDMGMKVNPRDSLAFFMEALEPYADHILKGDDEYFLREHIEVEDEYHDLSQQLKVWWPTLEDSQHIFIKNQFKLLLMLGAIATKHQAIRAIINQYRDPANQLVF
jgi:hypothetical protein